MSIMSLYVLNGFSGAVSTCPQCPYVYPYTDIKDIKDINNPITRARGELSTTTKAPSSAPKASQPNTRTTVAGLSQSKAATAPRRSSYLRRGKWPRRRVLLRAGEVAAIATEAGI